MKEKHFLLRIAKERRVVTRQSGTSMSDNSIKNRSSINNRQLNDFRVSQSEASETRYDFLQQTFLMGRAGEGGRTISPPRFFYKLAKVKNHCRLKSNTIDETLLNILKMSFLKSATVISQS